MRLRSLTPAVLRNSAIRRSLFAPLGLAAAIERLGYVQADPIRAPARAQDLILRPRVRGYRDGDLERRYHRVGAEEDVLHNYGFLPRSAQALLHPRSGIRARRSQPALEARVLEFMRGRGPTHPRELDAHFGKTTVANAWGGQSSMSSRALDHLHYRGHLRVARREQGIRIYEAAPHLQELAERPLTANAQIEGAVLLLLRLYAPMPAASLRQVVRMLGYGAPQLRPHLERFDELLPRLRQDGLIDQAVVDGVSYVGRPANACKGASRRRWCACSRPSTRWCGTGAASNTCGAGLTVSRPICRRRGGAWVTTRCPCCGAATWWVGPTYARRKASCR